MKKHLFLIALFFCFCIRQSSSQNLVLNPSLENYIICPGFGQFSNTYINNWSKPSYGSTDYYHTACPGIYPASQAPHTGNAYFGIIAYNYGTEYREYATGELSAPLVSGTQYVVSFYVSLNDGYIQAVQEMGAYLSPAAPGPFANSLHIAVTPQIENNTGILGDTALWTLVSGTFTAAGGEQYITIGNFHDDLTTTIAMVGSIGSFGTYYFVDDVSITEVPEGIAELDGGTVSVYPSVSNGIYTLEIKNADAKNLLFEITDLSGKKMITENVEMSSGNFEKKVDLSSFGNGIYFLRLFSGKEVLHYRLVKM
jgi:OOP family OmpA-OmpF porin